MSAHLGSHADAPSHVFPGESTIGRVPLEAYIGAAIAVNPRPEGLEALLSLDRDALFFLFRVVWGLIGPLALSYFIWRTAEMKSNQAATGLLYVALVFVLIGELLSSYLTVATGFPA